MISYDPLELGYWYLAYDLGLIFSSPGRSPGRAIILSPASALALALAAAAAALAKSLTLKLFI